MSLYLAVFGKPRYLGLVNIGDTAPKAGCWIVIKTVRGLEMGLLGGSLSQEQEIKYRNTSFDEPSDDHTKGPEPMLQEVEFVGSADAVQLREYHLRCSDEEAALIRSRQILHNHQLQMKLVDVEYTMDRKKLFFYFTSEQRIDFRAYVRDLAKEFHIRIEMRQIGVRDEAKTVRGISPCGRPCCCGCWLHRFTPINIRMVKEQNLALNPTKISGICGRLMCCMAYEYSTYSELWRSLPNPGTKIKTADGTYVLEGVDLQTKSVRVRFPAGREVSISVSEFASFKETILRGEVWEKDTAEDLPHRVSFPTRTTHSTPADTKTSASSHGASPKENSRDDAVRNRGKKLKPEKISLEEHIAGRIAEKALNLPKTESPVNTENAPAKKRSRKRKSGGAQSETPLIPESKQTVPAPKETKEQGVQKGPQPPRWENPRPVESRSAPLSSADGTPSSSRHRRRFRSHNSGEEHGREKQDGIR